MFAFQLYLSQVRILDVSTGQVILVSHHPGKNPYEKLDPLGLTNTGQQHAVMGGEWESATDVSSRHHTMPSFRIRPKPMSAHGRQFIKNMYGELEKIFLLEIIFPYCNCVRILMMEMNCVIADLHYYDAHTLLSFFDAHKMNVSFIMHFLHLLFGSYQ